MNEQILMKVMKKTHIKIVAFLLLLQSTGCSSFLDRDIIATLQEKDVYPSYTYAERRVTAIYSMLRAGFNEIDGAMIASASDEAEHTLETSSIHQFNTGDWDAFSNPGNVWSNHYQAIRLVNQYLATKDQIDLDYLKLNSAQQETYQARLAELSRWENEVRFLRAYFHFELLKRYGGVPIITKVYALSDDASGLKRNTFAEVVQFIVDECDEIAPELPLIPVNADLGRVTRGAALALKSRVLLYAASDLYNNTSWADGYTHPEYIAMPSGDRTARWQAAATAAKAVILLTGANYALHNSYQTLFTTFNSPEIIFSRRQAANNTFEVANYPIGYDRGQSGTTPSANLVDVYEVKTGTTAVPFDWNNPTHAANPYANRDPRLAFSVLTNNVSFKGRPVEIWNGGLDGKGKEQATRTGYYLAKYVDPNINLVTGTTSVHTWIFIRLGEIYLNYAEALNECDPDNPEIKFYVDQVRTRPTVAMPELPGGLDQSEMRNRIRQERQVELAFEGHRVWDARRWMIAPATLGTPLKGVDITREGSTFTYTPITVESRTFQPKMYFYPIPQQELSKMDEAIQNPIW